MISGLPDVTPILKKLQRPFMYLAILLPFAVFVYYVYKYATNMPREDDYDAILVFLTNFKHADLPTKIELLLKQHNEHRIVPSRLVYAVYYSVFGQINFRHIILLNGVVLTLLFVNIAWFVRRAIPAYWLPCVVVTSMCLFDLSGFENMNFAMAGMQNIGVILAFTGSLFFYEKNGRVNLIPAFILQCICIFSSGNGNLGAAIIVLYAVLTKDKGKMATAISTLLVFAPLYYIHFNRPETNVLSIDPLKLAEFFLHSVGVHFSITYGIAAAGLMIAILIAALPVGKRLSVVPEALSLVCISLFALGSLGVMSIFRSSLPLWCATSSRYHIYSHMLTAIAFVFLIRTMQQVIFVKPIIAALIIGLAFFYYQDVKDGGYGMKAFRTELKTMNYHYPDSVRAKQIADEACKEDIYCIEKHREDNVPAIFR